MFRSRRRRLIIRAMRARLNEHRKTKFQPPSDTSQKEQCIAQVKANGNFYGPWIQ